MIWQLVLWSSSQIIPEEDEKKVHRRLLVDHLNFGGVCMCGLKYCTSKQMKTYWDKSKHFIRSSLNVKVEKSLTHNSHRHTSFGCCCSGARFRMCSICDHTAQWSGRCVELSLLMTRRTRGKQQLTSSSPIWTGGESVRGQTEMRRGEGCFMPVNQLICSAK